MRRALISDIHGNLEALDVVLEDIKAQGIDEIYCLGDIIGYGPNPRECIDRVIEISPPPDQGDHHQQLDRFLDDTGDQQALQEQQTERGGWMRKE